jgi:hypothetical protein
MNQAANTGTRERALPRVWDLATPEIRRPLTWRKRNKAAAWPATKLKSSNNTNHYKTKSGRRIGGLQSRLKNRSSYIGFTGQGEHWRKSSGAWKPSSKSGASHSVNIEEKLPLPGSKSKGEKQIETCKRTKKDFFLLRLNEITSNLRKSLFSLTHLIETKNKFLVHFYFRNYENELEK